MRKLLGGEFLLRRDLRYSWYDEAVGMGLEMGLTSLSGALGFFSLVRSWGAIQ